MVADRSKLVQWRFLLRNIKYEIITHCLALKKKLNTTGQSVDRDETTYKTGRV
jgi:hypothetical protein